MGMAASQARLLSLTARLHDVELKAQNIMSQKIALATQKDELYRDYCDALDATTIKVAFRDPSGLGTTYVDANYSTLCTYNPDRVKQYALKDNQTGQMIVSEETKRMYESFGNDKYAFAYAMLGFDQNYNWEESGRLSESGIFVGVIGIAHDMEESDLNYIKEPDGSYSLYMTECEQMVFDEVKASDENGLAEKYQEIFDAQDNKTKQKKLDEFREILYTNYGKEIFAYMNINKAGEKGEDDSDLSYPDLDWSKIKGEFDYYVRLWSAINEAGGCQTVDPRFESGDDGNTWFNNMVESGLVTIQVWDDTGARKSWSDTSVATSTNNNHLQEMQNDKDLKKAEAEYEHELGILNRKDTKFDTELSKLETERKSITTEMESIEKVRDDNVDRTFGIFS